MHGPVSSSASRTGAARASDEVQVDARATGAVPHPEARHDADANTDHPPVMMFRGRQGTTAGHRGETLVPTAACRYELPHAKVAELADAQDSGSCGLNTRGGSSPPFRTYRASSSRSARVLASSFPPAGVNREYGGPIPGPFRAPRRARSRAARAPCARGVQRHRGAYGVDCAEWLAGQRRNFSVRGHCEQAILRALEHADLPAWKVHQRIGGRFNHNEVAGAIRALMATGAIVEVGQTPRKGPIYGLRGRHREA